MVNIDMLLYNGQIYTIDKENNVETWMAIKDGKIYDLGRADTYKKYINSTKNLIDLEKKIVFPGFYDSHVHLVQTGLNTMAIDASKVENIKELQELIKSRAILTPEDELINVIGYDEYKVEEKRIPSRQELDKCSKKHGIWVNTVEYHTGVVNSYLLHKLKLPFNLEGISRDEKGMPDGRMYGKASAFVRNTILGNIADSERAEGVFKSISRAAAKGVTTINAMEGGFSFHNKDAIFIEKSKYDYDLDLVLFYQTVNMNKAKEIDAEKLGGCIFIDGSFMTRTAALKEPYEDDKTTNGVLYFTQEELDKFVIQAHSENYQIALHAIGERAIDQVLNSFEKAIHLYPDIKHRHRIEHFELATDEHMKKARELNLIISAQPSYEYLWGGEGKLYDIRLGDRRFNTNRFRSLIDKGLLIIGGSDSDVTPIDPLLGIQAAISHPIEKWSIDRIEAVKMFTINAAYAVFEEEVKGSLEVDKMADLVILDEDPFKVEKNRIKDIKIISTIKQGKVIYQSKGVVI